MTAALALAFQALDAAATLAAVAVHGPAAEQNPLTSGALAFGPLGLLAWKASLTALVFAAAAMNARWRPLLLGGLVVSGAIGAASGLVVVL